MVILKDIYLGITALRSLLPFSRARELHVTFLYAANYRLAFSTLKRNADIDKIVICLSNSATSNVCWHVHVLSCVHHNLFRRLCFSIFRLVPVEIVLSVTSAHLATVFRTGWTVSQKHMQRPM